MAIFAGMAVPQYMGGLSGYTALQSGFASVPVLGSVLGTEVVARTVYIVGGVQMAVGGVIAFVLDNTVAGTREERGLLDWERIAEGDDEFQTFLERLRS